jgi:hypothetical protein
MADDGEQTLGTREITIAGVVVEIADVFAPGYVLKEGDAYQLNQVRAENIRNNLSSLVKEEKAKVARELGKFKQVDGKDEPDIDQVSTDDLDVEAIQARVDKYAAEYQFGVGAGGGARAPKDPVEREAQAMATEVIKSAFRSKGYKQPKPEKLKELVAQLLDKDPTFREKAKARVEEVKSIDLSALGI